MARDPWMGAEVRTCFDRFVRVWNTIWAHRYPLPPITESLRKSILKSFWRCWRDTRDDSPFDHLDTVELGIARCHAAQITLPGVWGFIAKKPEGDYGVQRFYARGAAQPQTTQSQWRD